MSTTLVARLFEHIWTDASPGLRAYMDTHKATVLERLTVAVQGALGVESFAFYAEIRTRYPGSGELKPHEKILLWDDLGGRNPEELAALVGFWWARHYHQSPPEVVGAAILSGREILDKEPHQGTPELRAKVAIARAGLMAGVEATIDIAVREILTPKPAAAPEPPVPLEPPAAPTKPSPEKHRAETLARAAPVREWRERDGVWRDQTGTEIKIVGGQVQVTDARGRAIPVEGSISMDLGAATDAIKVALGPPIFAIGDRLEDVITGDRGWTQDVLAHIEKHYFQGVSGPTLEASKDLYLGWAANRWAQDRGLPSMKHLEELRRHPKPPVNVDSATSPDAARALLTPFFGNVQVEAGKGYRDWEVTIRATVFGGESVRGWGTGKTRAQATQEAVGSWMLWEPYWKIRAKYPQAPDYFELPHTPSIKLVATEAPAVVRLARDLVYAPVRVAADDPFQLRWPSLPKTAKLELIAARYGLDVAGFHALVAELVREPYTDAVADMLGTGTAKETWQVRTIQEAASKLVGFQKKNEWAAEAYKDDYVGLSNRVPPISRIQSDDPARVDWALAALRSEQAARPEDLDKVKAIYQTYVLPVTTAVPGETWARWLASRYLVPGQKGQSGYPGEDAGLVLASCPDRFGLHWARLSADQRYAALRAAGYPSPSDPARVYLYSDKVLSEDRLLTYLQRHVDGHRAYGTNPWTIHYDDRKLVYDPGYGNFRFEYPLPEGNKRTIWAALGQDANLVSKVLEARCRAAWGESRVLDRVQAHLSKTSWGEMVAATLKGHGWLTSPTEDPDRHDLTRDGAQARISILGSLVTATDGVVEVFRKQYDPADLGLIPTIGPEILAALDRHSRSTTSATASPSTLVEYRADRNGSPLLAKGPPGKVAVVTTVDAVWYLVPPNILLGKVQIDPPTPEQASTAPVLVVHRKVGEIREVKRGRKVVQVKDQDQITRHVADSVGLYHACMAARQGKLWRHPLVVLVDSADLDSWKTTIGYPELPPLVQDRLDRFDYRADSLDLDPLVLGYRKAHAAFFEGVTSDEDYWDYGSADGDSPADIEVKRALVWRLLWALGPGWDSIGNHGDGIPADAIPEALGETGQDFLEDHGRFPLPPDWPDSWDLQNEAVDDRYRNRISWVRNGWYPGAFSGGTAVMASVAQGRAVIVRAYNRDPLEESAVPSVLEVLIYDKGTVNFERKARTGRGDTWVPTARTQTQDGAFFLKVAAKLTAGPIDETLPDDVAFNAEARRLGLQNLPPTPPPERSGDLFNQPAPPPAPSPATASITYPTAAEIQAALTGTAEIPVPGFELTGFGVVGTPSFSGRRNPDGSVTLSVRYADRRQEDLVYSTEEEAIAARATIRAQFSAEAKLRAVLGEAGMKTIQPFLDSYLHVFQGEEFGDLTERREGGYRFIAAILRKALIPDLFGKDNKRWVKLLQGWLGHEYASVKSQIEAKTKAHFKAIKDVAASREAEKYLVDLKAAKYGIDDDQVVPGDEFFRWVEAQAESALAVETTGVQPTIYLYLKTGVFTLKKGFELTGLHKLAPSVPLVKALTPQRMVADRDLRDALYPLVKLSDTYRYKSGQDVKKARAISGWGIQVPSKTEEDPDLGYLVKVLEIEKPPAGWGRPAGPIATSPGERPLYTALTRDEVRALKLGEPEARFPASDSTGTRCQLVHWVTPEGDLYALVEGEVSQGKQARSASPWAEAILNQRLQQVDAPTTWGWAGMTYGAYSAHMPPRDIREGCFPEGVYLTAFGKGLGATAPTKLPPGVVFDWRQTTFRGPLGVFESGGATLSGCGGLFFRPSGEKLDEVRKFFGKNTIEKMVPATGLVATTFPMGTGPIPTVPGGVVAFLTEDDDVVTILDGRPAQTPSGASAGLESARRLESFPLVTPAPGVDLVEFQNPYAQTLMAVARGWRATVLLNNQMAVVTTTGGHLALAARLAPFASREDWLRLAGPRLNED